MKVLAIDQGTTSTRAMIIDAAGGLQPLLSRRHRQLTPQPGWVEHDPVELLSSLRACLDAAAAVPGLAAVGIANQGESCLAWEAESLAPLGPVIVWQDDRTATETARLADAGAAGMVRARAGLPLDPYFSASKLGWIMQHLPEARRLAAKGRLRLGTTDAWFRECLTGRFETDAATASRTSLMNLAARTWDPELCRLFGVPIEALPPIGATGGDLGAVTIGGRAVPLGASVVDQQAALYGHGCRLPGDAKITFGTGAFALVLTGALPPDAAEDAGALPTLAWAKAGEAPCYALDGGVYAAAAALDWARGLGLFGDWAEIGDADAPPAIARGIAFVPALAGLACPHWDRGARGAWMGLDLATGPADMAAAVLEGIAYRMAEVMERMAQVQTLRDPVPVDGGMSTNPRFCQFLADALGRRLLIASEPEQTALGLGMLAAEGIGSHVAAERRGRIVSPRVQPPHWRARFTAARQAVQAYRDG